MLLKKRASAVDSDNASEHDSSAIARANRREQEDVHERVLLAPGRFHDMTRCKREDGDKLGALSRSMAHSSALLRNNHLPW